MQDAFYDFLRERQISEEVITFFKDQNIDTKTLLLMEDEELKKYIPRFGDRLTVIDFCKRNSSEKKLSLIEKLREKMAMKNKKNNSSEAGSSGNIKKKIKKSRKVEVGWLHMCPEKNRYIQVRLKQGGGTRQLFVDQEDRPHVILEKAKNLFFPQEYSTKGNLNDFQYTLLDFKQLPVDNELTIGDIFNITGVTKLRFYLATKTTSSDSLVHLESCDSLTTEIKYIEDTNIDSDSYSNPDSNSLSSQLVASEEKEEYHTTSELRVATSPEVAMSHLDFVEDLVGLPYVELWDDSKSEIETLILHRGQIFQDMLKAFEETFFDHSNLRIEMILPNGQSEMAEDIGGVYRDSLSEFWFTFYDKCTVGTTFKVPYLRHDFGEKQWKSVAKIFIRGFEIEKYIPIKLSSVFIRCCFCKRVEEKDLIENYLQFVCESDRELLQAALNDFDSVDQEELVDFFSNLDAKWLPSKKNFKQLLIDIAHIYLIQKPAFVTKCFASEIEKKGTLSFDAIMKLYSEITPTVKHCLSKVLVKELTLNEEQKRILEYLKTFIKESDEKTRTAFFRFCTGSDLPIMPINVTFSVENGMKRMPIAHTCSGLLSLPLTYENYVTFRSELNSILSSNVWVMDIV